VSQTRQRTATRPAGLAASHGVSEADDIAEAGQQLIEVQLPFTRPKASPPRVSRDASGTR
jgi:hypothetical protein